MYTYSIIIPHKNIPELLERCLASIPERDDIQTIIVDDSSDEKLVDFGRFPGLKRPNTEVIFHKSPAGKGGSGVARNIGMDVARGRWLVFADADDFFHPTASAMFDKYATSEADIVFFRHDSVDSNTLEPVHINTKRNRTLAEFDKNGDDTPLRYNIQVPWGKFIKRELVDNNRIRFDEVRFSTSLMFSLRTGHAAQKIISDPAILYCNVRREGSLIHEGRRDWDAMQGRFDVDYRAAKYILEAGRGRLFQRVVADRWLELHSIDRQKAKQLLPALKEVCSPLTVRRAKFKSFFQR